MAKKITISEPLEEIVELPVKPVIPEIASLKVDQTPKEKFGEDYFKNIEKAGINLAAKGAWQKMYAHFIDRLFKLKGKRLLDIGCAFGAITSSFADYGIEVLGNDISQYALSKSPFKNFTKIVSPAHDLKMIQDSSVDIIHSMYCFNEIEDSDLKKTFEEIYRIGKKDGIVFIILQFAPEVKDQNGKMIHNKSFYDMFAKEVGLVDISPEVYHKAYDIIVPGWDFMRKYHWDFLAYKVKKE